MPGQGNVLTTKDKEIIVKLKDYFDQEKKLSGKKSQTKSSTAKVAESLGLSVTSIQRTIREFKKNGDFAAPAKKGATPYSIDDGVKTICRDIIRKHNIERAHLSIRVLSGILKEKHQLDVPRETLRAYLSRWGIVYGPVQRHTALRERDYVVCARREYLIEKRRLDKSNQTLVYLDETFINKNHSGSDWSWYCEDWKEDSDLDKSHGPYINKPSGKGERLIILNAVTEEGWVPGAELVFKANTNSGDYHGSMDEENFRKWFTTQLLPNIPDDSVIIMDNASYHNSYSDDGVPSLNSKKVVLQKWLDDNDISYDSESLRPQLIELINTHRPERHYSLDEILRLDYEDRNIKILRTPQYHPELQPIEKCWAVIKQYMAQHCDFTNKGLRENLNSAWGKVTKATMSGILKKVNYWQNYHFDQDGLLDSVDEDFCL